LSDVEFRGQLWCRSSANRGLEALAGLSRQDVSKLPHQCLALLGIQPIEIPSPPSDSRQVGGGIKADSGQSGSSRDVTRYLDRIDRGSAGDSLELPRLTVFSPLSP
jgi:hypothetical protein